MAAPFEPPTRPAHSINARSINSRSLMLTAALKEMDGSARDADSRRNQLSST